MSLLKRSFIALTLACPGLAFANGFAVWPQSGSAVGDYAAGAAASNTNPDAAYYNPAGATYFSGQMAGFSLINQFGSSKFDGTVNQSPAVSGFSPNSGTEEGGQYTALPSIMYVAPISNRWAFTLSASTPYSMDTRFNSSAFTRYTEVYNDFDSYDIGPSLAYKPMEKISFGLGFDAIYTREKFRETVTSGSIGNDTGSTNRASGWAYGYHVGLFFKPTDKTQMGISYRSENKVKGSGDSHTGSASSRDKYSIDLPAMTIISLQQKIDDQWTGLASAVYTQWNQLGLFQLTNVADASGPQTINIASELKNTWQYMLGAHYQANKKWMLMGALGYEQDATKSTDRTMILPDGDHATASIGAEYRINSNFSAIAGYTHLFNDNQNINTTETFGTQTITTTGTSKTNADLIGLELDWKMT